MRTDFEAGLISAILILPQAIALATLAGMPPEYGIYSSIIPVIVATLWGSSWHTLSGPNTALCVLIASSIAPFASPGTPDYVGYALALTLMVGIIELVVGLSRVGMVLDFISHTVVSALTFAVALVIIISAASTFLGVMGNPDEPFYIRLYQTIFDLPRANPYALAVGIATIGSGMIARRLWRKYALVIAVVTGCVAGYLVNLAAGPATTQLALLGHLSLSALPFSQPKLNLESAYVLKELLTGAFAIAFLGLMQTVVIARSLATKSGQRVDTNQEIVAQGLANIVAPFFSCFAGSGSFNRSAAHYEAGARTPMAAIYASLLLAAIVFVLAPAIAYMPLPVVAGALMLVGYGLLDYREIKRAARSRSELAIFALTAFSALAFGLENGVLVGLLISIAIYLRQASKPNVIAVGNIARDGSHVTSVTIDGGLFFGSAHFVERRLSELAQWTDHDRHLILLRTDHLTYFDAAGAAMLAAFSSRQRGKGDDIYLYVTRESVIDTLRQSGFLEAIGVDHIIERDHDHPLKEFLYPFSRKKQAWHNTRTPQTDQIANGEKNMNTHELARRLKTTKMFSHLTLEQLASLLSGCELLHAAEGTELANRHNPFTDQLVLVNGTIETVRTWQDQQGQEKSVTMTLQPMPANGNLALLGLPSHGISARALSDVTYLMINGSQMDEMLGSGQYITLFRHLPREDTFDISRHMTPKDFQAGDTVVRQGEPGDYYYLIESGNAEVWRVDPFTEENLHVADLGPNDTFGEEALIQNGCRNATVRMVMPGRLLAMSKADFETMIQPGMVQEVSPETARHAVHSDGASLLDCRYDMEYEESHIPGAILVPLDQLRENISQLDPAAKYVVYCRSGRRSQAAVFLLRERGINAVSLKGGIRDWPYEVASEAG